MTAPSSRSGNPTESIIPSAGHIAINNRNVSEDGIVPNCECGGAVRNGETFVFTDMVGYAKGQALDEAAMITSASRQLDAIIESSGERAGS